MSNPNVIHEIQPSLDDSSADPAVFSSAEMRLFDLNWVPQRALEPAPEAAEPIKAQPLSRAEMFLALADLADESPTQLKLSA